MSNLKRILSSFKVRESLNPKIWVKKDNEIVMNPKVREKLLEVANDFIEYLKVDVVVTDIIMTGSLANFNWSSFSDVDLHIVADFSQFPEEQLDLYKELFTLKKTLYNEKHDITIYGYDVELYVQNETEAHFSSGVYSVLYNEWSNKPKKENVKIDTSLIKTKTNQWMDIIDGVIKNASDEPIDNARQIIKKYKDKLKKYRTCGLEKQGEYSDENLVFKVLRRNGYIEKLHDFENKLVDKTYTLKEGETSIGGPFKTDIENGPSNHGKRAFGNWQSDNAWDVFAPPGSVVNAYTEGKVIKIRNTNKRSGKVFGTQVTVKGEGVRFWGFGKTVYQEILGYMADADYGDITDPESGRDITVEVVSAEDSGTSYPVTTIRVKPKETPLAATKAENDKFLNEQKEITDLYSELTYAELKNVLEGWLNPSAASEDEKSVNFFC